MTTNPPAAGPQSEAQRALEKLTTDLSDIVLLCDYSNDLSRKQTKYAREALSLVPTLRAALAPPATPSPPGWLMDLDEASAVKEIAAIRGRHAMHEQNGLHPDSMAWRQHHVTALLAHVDRLSAELAAERERRVEVEGALAAYEAALDPNETKAAYIGEFKNEDCSFVSWTTIKEIMAAIKARATQHEDTP